MKDFLNSSIITPEVQELSKRCVDNSRIDSKLYIEHKVNRGLRDLNGRGVLTGLTEISDIISKKNVDGEEVPCEGELYYRGYRVEDLVAGMQADKRFGFEEIIYLLLFGQLPNIKELEEFKSVLFAYRPLPNSFIRDIIMNKENTNNNYSNRNPD